MPRFSELKGKTLISLEVKKIEDEDQVEIKTLCGKKYLMLHYEDCCEHVFVEDIAGDISDILNREILIAEEVSADASSNSGDESGTWTFYKLDTHYGGITIRWMGESNGYYSEEVSFIEVKDD